MALKSTSHASTIIIVVGMGLLKHQKVMDVDLCILKDWCGCKEIDRK